MTTTIKREIGARIRAARLAQGWALEDLDRESGGEFKVSVVGAYERGERAITAARLVAIAEWLHVDAATLLAPSPHRTYGADAVRAAVVAALNNAARQVLHTLNLPLDTDQDSEARAA